MEIRKIETDKKEYLSLLLLADEQEDMIDRYLEQGDMYVLDDGGVRAECVVTDEGNGILELKNLAVRPDSQGKGYGRQMIRFVADTYRKRFRILQVDQETARRRFRFMRSVVSADPMLSGIFLQSTMTIRSMKAERDLWIWCI